MACPKRTLILLLSCLACMYCDKLPGASRLSSRLSSSRLSSSRLSGRPASIVGQTQSFTNAGTGAYAFSFDADNGISRTETGSLSANGGIVQTGEYSYPLDNGTVVLVKYTADENGFRPEYSHLPGTGEIRAPSRQPQSSFGSNSFRQPANTGTQFPQSSGGTQFPQSNGGTQFPQPNGNTDNRGEFFIPPSDRAHPGLAAFVDARGNNQQFGSQQVAPQTQFFSGTNANQAQFRTNVNPGADPSSSSFSSLDSIPSFASNNNAGLTSNGATQSGFTNGVSPQFTQGNNIQSQSVINNNPTNAFSSARTAANQPTNQQQFQQQHFDNNFAGSSNSIDNQQQSSVFNSPSQSFQTQNQPQSIGTQSQAHHFQNQNQAQFFQNQNQAQSFQSQPQSFQNQNDPQLFQNQNQGQSFHSQEHSQSFQNQPQTFHNQNQQAFHGQNQQFSHDPDQAHTFHNPNVAPSFENQAQAHHSHDHSSFQSGQPQNQQQFFQQDSFANQNHEQFSQGFQNQNQAHTFPSNQPSQPFSNPSQGFSTSPSQAFNNGFHTRDRRTSESVRDITPPRSFAVFNRPIRGTTSESE